MWKNGIIHINFQILENIFSIMNIIENLRAIHTNFKHGNFNQIVFYPKVKKKNHCSLQCFTAKTGVEKDIRV